MSDQPTVSIIISAYNRPKVIPFAIKSVLASDFDDWEMIVVGDGCNTETQEAINAFSDPRIKFHNLPKNTGHQSAPHNKGVEMASGTYVFFLNQDDMFFPDHLSTRVDYMRTTGADISWSPVLLLQHSGIDNGPVDPEKDRLVLDGAVSNGRFHPKSFVISSCWAVRRDVCTQVGPWLPIEETRLSPSQEWLYRAYKQNRKMAYHPHVSVLCIHSGVRRYSYVNAESIEHERAWSWISAGAVERLRLLECVSVHMAGDLFEARNALARHQRPILTAIQSLSRRFGFHPDTVERNFEGLSKGSWVRNHTKFTSSAPPVVELHQTVSFGKGEAEDFVGRGWHEAEPNGRWSSQETAEVFFATTDENQFLELSGHPFRTGDTVEFLINNEKMISRHFPVGEEVLLVPVKSCGVNLLTIRVKSPTSPSKLAQSEDARTLAFWLTSMRMTGSTSPSTD